MKKNIVRKLLFVLVIALISPFTLFGQQKLIKPVTWKLTASKQNVKVGDVVELIFKTNDIPDKWHLYSNDFTTDGPQKTEHTYEKSSAYKLLTPLPKPIGQLKEYDDVWEGDVTFFKHKAEFRHKIKILSPNPTIKVNLYYQMCDEQCVQFDVDLELKIKTVGGGNAIETVKPTKTDSDKVTDTQNNNIDTTLGNSALIEKGVIDSIGKKNIEVDSGAYANAKHSTSILNDGDCEVKNFAGDSGEEKDNLILFFIIAFVSGLVALLTPCVFPMIPMTVTFFLKGNSSKAKGMRNAIIYGIFIILIYTIIGTLFSALSGAGGANEFSTNAVVNIIFFLVFVIFAVSFFGMFEITLPSAFVNKIDKQSDRGGLIGVFFIFLVYRTYCGQYFSRSITR